MLDYLALQGSTENPTVVTVAFTVLLSFLLSSAIAFTYDKTTRTVVSNADFLQAIILVAIVAATVMQAIGDSLARGLGMLGALAIIRFRTNVRAPRNMVFVFASLATGIACGVYGFVIAILGTIGFCSVAFILRFSPMSKMTNLTGSLKFETSRTSDDVPILEEILKRYCRKFAKTKHTIGYKKVKGLVTQPVVPPERITMYEYKFSLKNESELGLLDNAVGELRTLEAVKLSFDNLPESI